MLLKHMAILTIKWCVYARLNYYCVHSFNNLYNFFFFFDLIHEQNSKKKKFVLCLLGRFTVISQYHTQTILEKM